MKLYDVLLFMLFLEKLIPTSVKSVTFSKIPYHQHYVFKNVIKEV